MLDLLGYTSAAGNGIFVFLFLVGLGSAAAWRTGQVVADGWGPVWPLALYAAALAASLRFLHYALFAGPLLSLPTFLVETAILLCGAALAYRIRRTRNMTEQYSWTFERTSPISWRSRRT